MKAQRIVALGILVILAATSAAYAGPAPTRDWKKRIELTQHPAGADYDAEGVTVIGTQNGVQFFRLRANAKLLDGETVTVWVENNQGQLSLVASLEMFLGSADLELISSRDPSAVFPVTNLRAVIIEWQGQKILDGTF